MADEQGSNPPPAAGNAADLIARGLAGPAAATAAKDAATPRPAGQPPGGYVSAADVEKLVAEKVGKALAEQGGKYAKEQSDGFIREQFVRQNMQDMPPAYHKLMPTTGDVAKLQEAEQSLRADFRNGLGGEVRAGRLAPVRSVGGDTAEVHGSVSPMVITNDKRSATEQIAAGLRKDGARGH